MRLLTLAATLAVLSLALAASASAVTVGPVCRATNAPVLCAIKVQHRAVNQWRARYGDRRATLDVRVREHPHRRPYYLWVEHARRVAARARYVGLWRWYEVSGASCVRSKEGTWRSATGNGFYGGYQYLPSTWLGAGGGAFAARADYATPTEQTRVTRTHVTRYGWGEWPNTAAACGLL